MEKYIHPPNCDYGSIIPESIPCIVFEDDGPSLIMPNRETPEARDLLGLAIMAKLDDKEWVRDLLYEVFGSSPWMEEE